MSESDRIAELEERLRRTVAAIRENQSTPHPNYKHLGGLRSFLTLKKPLREVLMQGASEAALCGGEE